MHEVIDGKRRYIFDGELLAEATSRNPTSVRWVEMQLYRAASGEYILARVGRSIVYHDPTCAVVQKSELEIAPRPENGVQCEICVPKSGVFCPERDLKSARVTSDPKNVVSSLYLRDKDQSHYLTRTARELLEAAGVRDSRIADAYSVEYI